MKEIWGRLGVLALAVMPLSLGCGQESDSVPSAGEDSLYIDPTTREFSENPALLERILSGPHGYLRFINLPFTQEVCRLFSDTVEGVPAFNLHGDAHLEQYAVTDLGRGLTDFDDSSTGPAVVDLVRFGVSLRLANESHGWQEEAEVMFDRFLEGYRGALEDPTTEAPVPAVAQRLSADFVYDRARYFEWVESIAEPVPPAEAKALVIAMGPYVEAMLIEHPELEAGYFQVEEVGYLRLGIGSALDRKYLVRIRGESDDPADDRLLELKQVRDLSGIDCISVGRGTDPFRILIGQSRIAYQPYSLLGYVRFDDLAFWIHAWVDNYVEASIDGAFRSPEELAEVAYDIGVQLGRGHPNQIASPLDVQLRREQLRLLERDENRIKATCRDLASRVTVAWQRFRAVYR